MEELIVCGNVHVPVWCPKRSELPAWWWGTVGGGYNNRILWGALLLRQEACLLDFRNSNAFSS